MPIPNPKVSEKQSDFMIRCVPMLTPYHKKDQAIAICYEILSLFRPQMNRETCSEVSRSY